MKKNYFLFLFLLLCGMATAQMNVRDSLSHQNFQRLYTVHLPPGFTGNTPVPLLLFMHGGSGDQLSAQGFTRLNQVSNANGFLVVYPEGIGPVSGGGFSWADGRGTSADSMLVDDVGFVDKLLDSLIRDYPIDTSRIFLSGFSNGAFMTQRIACEMNERFAGMASLGSTIDTALIARCNPGRPLPMVIVMGTLDPFVPYNGGPMNGGVTPIVATDSVVQFWVRNNNCRRALDSVAVPDIDQTDSSTVSVFEFTDCDCDADVKLYKVIGAGHTWPGVENVNYEIIAGETNEDINAGEEIWDFFTAHPFCRVMTGVEMPASDGKGPWLVVYPNPTSGYVHILSDARQERVAVFNLTGARVVQKMVGEQKSDLNLEGLPAGIYVLRVRFSSGELATRRLVIR